MKNILLIWLPFCTPASPPFSIANLYSFLKANLDMEEFSLQTLDMNIEFHKKKFPKFQEYFKNFNKNYDEKEYEKISKEFKRISGNIYSENNKKVINGEKPEYFQEFINEIITAKPDIAAFSIVYSSQAFYALALLKELKKAGIKTIIGGPSVNEKLEKAADLALKDSKELLENLTDKKDISLNYNNILDFKIFELDDYFVPETVIPIKTSNSCYYRQCTFCTHHKNEEYKEFDLANIKKTITKTGKNKIFIVDDMISKKRMLEIAAILKPLNIKWMCQLKPTKEFDKETLKILNESGLKIIMWGIESGNDRILKLINKGTNETEINKTLKDSHDAGIRNIAYIIFGFPTETKEEFLDTIKLLKDNEQNIDLVSTSIFGLQKGTKIYDNPKMFGITQITEKQRTVLEPTISYETDKGLNQQGAKLLRKKYKRTLEKIDKFPKTMNFFREHMLCLC